MADNAHPADGELTHACREPTEAPSVVPEAQPKPAVSLAQSNVDAEPRPRSEAAEPAALKGGGTTAATATRSTARLALGVGLLAVVALGSLVGWSGWNTYQRHSDEQQRQAYLQGARQGALNLTTIDSQNADTDIQRILDGSTGAFHDDFQKRSRPFIAAVKQAESKTQGTIAEAVLESVAHDQAQVLLAVEVRTSVAGVEEPQPRAWRMRINVQDVGSQVKVSNVAFVP